MYQKGSSYGKQLKINVGAPKNWLKTKYMPNSRAESGIYSQVRSNNGVIA